MTLVKPNVLQATSALALPTMQVQALTPPLKAKPKPRRNSMIPSLNCDPEPKIPTMRLLSLFAPLSALVQATYLQFVPACHRSHRGRRVYHRLRFDLALCLVCPLMELALCLVCPLMELELRLTCVYGQTPVPRDLKSMILGALGVRLVSGPIPLLMLAVAELALMQLGLIQPMLLRRYRSLTVTSGNTMKLVNSKQHNTT